MPRIWNRPAILSWLTPQRVSHHATRAPATGPTVVTPFATPIPSPPPPCPRRPAGWPFCSTARAMAHLRACNEAAPEHFVGAWVALAKVESYENAVQMRHAEILQTAVQRHGVARLQPLLQRAIGTLRDSDQTITAAVVVGAVAHAAPTLVNALARPSDLRLGVYGPHQARTLFAALHGDMREWAQIVFKECSFAVVQAFVLAGADAAWGGMGAHLIANAPRALWAVLQHSHPAAVAAWQPAAAPRPPLTSEAVAQLLALPRDSVEPLDTLVTALAHAVQSTPDVAEAQAIIDGTVPRLWTGAVQATPVLVAAQKRGLYVANALAAATHHAVPVDGLLACVSQLPPAQVEALGGLPHYAVNYMCTDREMGELDMLAWLGTHAPQHLDAWRLGVARFLNWRQVPHPLSPSMRRELIQLLAHRPARDWGERRGKHITSQMLPGLDALHTAIRRRGLHGRIYQHTCQLLGIDAATATAWQPWLQKLAASYPENETHGLGFMAAHLSRYADPAARAAVENLPAPIAEVLGLPVQSSAHAVAAHVSPTVLRAVALALEHASASCKRTVLPLLQSHAPRMPNDVCLTFAKIALSDDALPVWPWLRHTRNVANGEMQSWIKIVLQRPDEAPPTDAHLRSQVEHALLQAHGPHLPGLLRWLMQHPELEHSAANLDLSQLQRLTAPDRDAVLTYLYNRPPAQLRALVATDTALALLTPHLLHAYGAHWLTDQRNAPTKVLPTAARALACTIWQRPLSDSLVHVAPELALVHAPQNRQGWRAVLRSTHAPTWLDHSLQREKPVHGADAEQAQSNRLRALGRYVHWCRALNIPDALRDAAGKVVQQLLLIADDGIRHTLLRGLVGTVLLAASDNSTEKTRLDTVLSVPERAIPLALACALLLDPEQASAPFVTALLQSRAVYGHGAYTRTLLGLVTGALRGDITRKFARDTLTWATAPNLLRMLNNPANDQRRVAMLRAAQRNDTATLQQLVSQHATVCRTRLALHQDQAQPSMGSAPLTEDTEEAMVHALTWLTTTPLGDVAGKALALLHQGSELSSAALSRVRSALKAVPKAQRPLANYCDVLLQDLLSQWPQAPRSPSDSPTPSAAFFGQQAVRTFMQDQVLPLMLELTEHAPLVEQLGKQPSDFCQASSVFAGCLNWTELSPANMQRLRLHPNVKYLNAYAANMFKTWNAPVQKIGLPLLRQAAAAMVDGTTETWRRAGAQAQSILSDAQGRALWPRWETCTPLALAWPPAEPHATWSVFDTGDPAAMLAATTQVSSCQSAHVSGNLNRGMLSRMRDGAKRMLVLQDEDGKVRARATLRLMRGAQQPVLLASRLYAPGGGPSADIVEACQQWLAARAKAMGIEAYVAWSSRADGPGSVELSCAGDALPDYWDESASIETGAVRLRKKFEPVALP